MTHMKTAACTQHREICEKYVPEIPQVNDGKSYIMLDDESLVGMLVSQSVQ